MKTTTKTAQQRNRQMLLLEEAEHLHIYEGVCVHSFWMFQFISLVNCLFNTEKALRSFFSGYKYKSQQTLFLN